MKKLNDSLEDDFGLNDLDLKQIKKYKKNYNQIMLVVFIISVFILYFFYYKISNEKNEIIIENVIKEKNKTILVDTLETSIKEKELSKTPISIKEAEVIIISERTGKYFIISGSFKDYNLSLKEANKFLEKGFQSSIVLPVKSKNDFYRVAIDAHMNRIEAINTLNEYKINLNNELWILKY